jgi:protein-tyrosine phosphatase
LDLRTTVHGWRHTIHRFSSRWYGPDPRTTWLTWIADERLAVGTMPTGATIDRLVNEGITHVVNCRTGWETFLSQDLYAERALLGSARVVRAPMWDHGRRQHPRRWSAAASFVASTLAEDGTARVLIHCKAGVHRSVMVAYAVLRLRNHSPDDAADLIHQHRAEAELLPRYRASVEVWLASRQRD